MDCETPWKANKGTGAKKEGRGGGVCRRKGQGSWDHLTGVRSVVRKKLGVGWRGAEERERPKEGLGRREDPRRKQEDREGRWQQWMGLRGFLCRDEKGSQRGWTKRKESLHRKLWEKVCNTL